MISRLAALRPCRRTLLAQWFADFLISSIIVLPFLVPLSIEQTARFRQLVERLDVWQFDSMPTDHHRLQAWADRQNDLEAFRVYPLNGKDQIVLRYIRGKKQGVARPDWDSLGYFKPHLLSTDSLPVGKSPWPPWSGSGFGWLSEGAGDLVCLTVLFRRLNRHRDTPPILQAPTSGSWWTILLVLPAVVTIHALGGHLEETIIPHVSGWALIPAVFSIGLASPAWEEILYRGCFFRRFRVHGYVASGAILSALAFSLAHGGPTKMIPQRFCVGLMLAGLCYRTGSLWPPFGVHVLWNAMTMLRTV